MNVLLLRANPRKAGYTQRLTDLFVEGLRDTSASVKDIDLCSLELNLCLGCYHCWLATPGQCVHGDAMSGVHVPPFGGKQGIYVARFFVEPR